MFEIQQNEVIKNLKKIVEKESF